MDRLFRTASPTGPPGGAPSRVWDDGPGVSLSGGAIQGAEFFDPFLPQSRRGCHGGFRDGKIVLGFWRQHGWNRSIGFSGPPKGAAPTFSGWSLWSFRRAANQEKRCAATLAG